jgi:hypothetical protein
VTPAPPAVDRTIPDDARREIERRLRAVESEHGVRLVLAVESGSRGWGFASPDSDFDVRFLYVSPPDWYLSVDLEERRDVIETPLVGLWDVNGWDLRKALRLFRKSNPPLLEWLQSPIIYLEATTVAARLRTLLPSFYSVNACKYHYLHMAQGNFHTYLQGEEVWTKKYFYVLRPLLACRWLENERGVVPMEFERLVDAADLSPEVRASIAALLTHKRAGAELRQGPRDPHLDAFIRAEFERHETAGVSRESPRADVEDLNVIFRAGLSEAWHAKEHL